MNMIINNVLDCVYHVIHHLVNFSIRKTPTEVKSGDVILGEGVRFMGLKLKTFYSHK